jgi:ketosteroid isomerase-like protein
MFHLPFNRKASTLTDSHGFYRWFGDAGIFELSELKITAGSDVAFCTGLIRCAESASGKSEELTVRLTVCYRKTDGQWMVMHEHHSEPSID